MPCGVVHVARPGLSPAAVFFAAVFLTGAFGVEAGAASESSTRPLLGRITVKSPIAAARSLSLA